MKAFFSKSTRRLPAKALALLAGFVLFPLAVMAADSGYTNTGTIFGTPPQVDATNFYNYGTWNISTTPLPYTTSDTLNFTNEGSMTGTVGWEFDYGPLPLGGRGKAASFFNDTPGTITAGDGFIQNPAHAQYFSEVSYLLISATNILNKGALVGGISGEMVLTGTTVTLSRSTLQIGSIISNAVPVQCSENDITLSNFTADAAIYDEYWVTNNLNLTSTAFWNGSKVTTPFFVVDAYSAGCTLVSNIAAPLGPDPISFVPTLADSITNNGPVGTNGLPAQIFNQAVFVLYNTNFMNASDSFYNFNTNNGGNISNLFSIITVRLGTTNTGPLYLSDLLGSSGSNLILFNNSAVPGQNPENSCSGPTYRPANYILERADCQSYFMDGTNGNGPPGASFFYNSSLSNNIVPAVDAAYGAYVDDLVRNPSGGAVTDLPGRIVIKAGNLDITRATITSAGGEIAIQASNLVGSAGAVVSCRNVSFNIGAASGIVNTTNFISSSMVPGLHGNLYAWSALWTNQMNVVVGSGTNATTNTIAMNFHVLVVDASQLTNTEPVAIQDLVLHSTNMIVSGSFSDVANSILFDGRSLTLDGAMTLSSANFGNWNSSIAPSLLYFTNNSTLTINQDAHFGDDTPSPYLAFVNNGSGKITVGGGETIDSAYFQDEGSDIAYGGYSVTASNALIDGATILSGQYINLAGGTFQLENATLEAGTSLNFDVTNSVTDNGVANILSCNNGFNLYIAPQSGNLSASAITDTASGNQFINHAWAGSDSGAGASGTANNVAIGTLALAAQHPSQLPTFHFYGTTGTNAMYVKTLDLTHLTDTPGNLNQTSLSMIQIDSNMKIYFSAVLVSPAFATALGAQTPAAFLQFQFPNQFIFDAAAGQSIGVSSNIVISSLAAKPGTSSFVLTWNSTAGATYSVLKTNVITGSSANWPVIVNGYPPGGAVGGPLSYTDTTATISPAYYRVRSP